MNKRSRRKRKTVHAARTVAIDDFSALRAQMDLHPEKATRRILGALRASFSDPNPPSIPQLDAAAADLAQKLRLAGNTSAALNILTAAQRRSPALRLEEALLAFALGNDDVAASLAATDEQVATVLHPLLAAAEGKVAPPGTANPISPALEALHTAAHAVARAVDGDLNGGRQSLQQIDATWQRQLLASELSAAIDLLDPAHVLDGIARLGKSPIARNDSTWRYAMFQEATAHDTHQVVHVLDEHFKDATADERQLCEMKSYRDRLASMLSYSEAADVIRHLKVSDFSTSDRAAAALYKGYGLLAVDLDTASDCFDQAIKLDGDLVEALRGKLLVELGLGVDSSSSKHRPPRVKQAATLAGRLSRLLERDSAARPLAAAAEMLAVELWIETGNDKASAASIARARSLGASKQDLELMEIDAMARHHPAAAKARIDALLQRDPTNLDAWWLNLDLAVRHGDDEVADRIIVDAAKATQEPRLVNEARRIQLGEGDLKPFEGFVSGQVSAGTLAREAAYAADLGQLLVEEQPDSPPSPAFTSMKVCRDALDREAQLALDAALLAVVARYGRDIDVQRQMTKLMRTWRILLPALCRLVAMAVFLGHEDAVEQASLTLVNDAPALITVVKALIVSGCGQHAHRLLSRLKNHLSRKDLSHLRKLAKDSMSRDIVMEGVPDADEAVREFDSWLAPQFSIAGFLRAIPKQPPLEETDEVDQPIPEAVSADLIAEFVLRLIGAPANAFHVLEPEHRMVVEREVAKIMTHPHNPSSERRLVALLQEAGIQIPSHPCLPSSADRGIA